MLHPHLPELIHPPRAQRKQFCSLGASSTHSCLHLALCCTKSYGSAQPRKPAKDLGGLFLALPLLRCGVLAMWLIASPPCFPHLWNRQCVLRHPASPRVLVAVTCLKFHIYLGSLDKGMHASYTSRHSTHVQSISTGLRTSVWLTGSRFCSRTSENCYRAQEIRMYVWKILCTAKYSDKGLYTHTIGKKV